MTAEDPRFDLVYEKACDFLLSSSANSLPINPKKIIKQNHWGLVTYRELAEKLKVSVKDIAAACQSKDGFTVKNGGNYCIAYNEAVEVNSRIAFTLMHEAGHIVLSHFDLKNEDEKLKLYETYEKEADYFAVNVLTPKAVVLGCGINTPEKLCAACCISKAAAKNRICEFRKSGLLPIDLKNNDFLPIDYEIAEKFSSYIEISKRRKLFFAVF